MKVEVASDLAPREVVAEALARLVSDAWTLRSLSDHHLHLAGEKRRPATGLKVTLACVAAVNVALVGAMLLVDDPYVGGRHVGEVLALYSLAAWPTALVAVGFHVLSTRGEAGIAIAATPLPNGGSRVLAQAYGSAFAVEEVEAFVERVAAAAAESRRAVPVAVEPRA